MPIPQHFIADLLARADIVDIISRHVQLKKAGANYLGLCPFHGEKTPSFSVSPTRQFFHCFGCGKSGDAIAFLMEHTGATFREAVEDLAQQCGLVVPEDERSPQERQRAAQQRQHQDTLADVLARAERAWRRQLKDAPHAIAYLKRRGLSGEIAARYALGYAAAGWHALASVFPDYASPLLLEAGLVVEKNGKRYDRFRDRITFPIRSLRGQIIGFGARTMGDEKPKYLNSPETALFHKGQELYGLHEARNALHQEGWALVVEGYMDVLALAQFGLGNAVATLGTACTSEHLRKLLRFASRVTFAFDGDTAGRKAARRALEAALPLASDTRSFRFLFLPPEHDPDSFIRAEGADAFRRAAQEALPLSRFMLEAAAEECDMGSAEGRAHFAANARALWQALPERGLLRQQLLGDIAARAGLNAAALLHTWGAQPPAAPRSGSTAAPARRPAFAPAPAPRLAMPQGLDAHARNATALLLRSAALWDELSEDERAALCSIPGPWGDALRWMEQQFLEHGNQSASAILHALSPDSPFFAHLNSLHTGGAPSEGDATHDLRLCVTRARLELANARMHAHEHTPGSADYLNAFRAASDLKRQLEALRRSQP